MARIAYSLVVLTVLASLFQIVTVRMTRQREDRERQREARATVAMHAYSASYNATVADSARHSIEPF